MIRLGRWWWSSAVVLLVAALAAAEPGAPKGELVVANTHLKSGRARQAMMSFRAILADHPKNHRARIGLLEAMADIGLCQQASAEGIALEGTAYDNAAARVALGRCAESLGSFDDALDHYRIAVESNRYNLDAMLHLADLLWRLGQAGEAQDLVDEARALDEGPARCALMEAIWAVRSEGPDADEQMFALTLVFRHHRSVRSELPLLAAIRDTDAGGCRPLVAMTASSLTNPVHGAYTAECLRRLGDLEAAETFLVRPALRSLSHTPLMSAIHARVAQDMGDPEAAEAWLEGLGESEIEVLASRWYLAQANQSPDGPRLLDRWRAHPGLALRNPMELLPLEE